MLLVERNQYLKTRPDIADVRVRTKLGQTDPKRDNIFDFLRSVFSTFWLGEPKCTEN